MTDSEITPPSLPSLQASNEIDWWKLFTLENIGSRFKTLLPVATAFGALLILVYLLSIEHVPNFDLASFAATFLAAALFAAFAIVVISGFCLVPGALARRIVVDARRESDRRDAESGLVRDADAPSFASLDHLRFILFLCCLGPLPWIWVLHDSLHSIFGQSWHGAIVGYVTVLGAALLSLVAYGNPRLNALRLASITIFIGAASYTAVLMMLSQPVPTHPVAPTLAATQAARDVATPEREPESVTSVPEQTRQPAGIHVQAAFAVGIGAALFFWWGYWHWKGRRIKSIRLSLDAQKLHAYRFLWIKLHAAATFLASYSVVLLASLSLATFSAPDDEGFAAVGAILLFTITNAIAFRASTFTAALRALAITGSLFFLIIPLWMHFPFMLPQLTARSLGLGAIRLEQITLDGKHCATLKRYGAACADKDAPLQLLDVNLLSRIGSSFVLELPIALGVLQGDAEAAPAQKATGDATRLSRILLAVDAAEINPTSRSHCDDLLAARAKSAAARRDGNFAPNAAFQCVRLIVPEGDVRSYVPDGPRTYTGRTAAVLEKKEPATGRP